MEPPLRAGRPAGRLLRAPSLPRQVLPRRRGLGSRCSGLRTNGRLRRPPPGCKSSATSPLRSSAPGGCARGWRPPKSHAGTCAGSSTRARSRLPVNGL
eukprot:15449782-Alexandrium_andersonii.AAC.1